jgi:hypothetical protein
MDKELREVLIEIARLQLSQIELMEQIIKKLK